MPGVDLHLHSTASDGRLSAADLIHKAVELGLAIIAIADHDSVDSIAPALEMAEAFPQLKVIPCVEVSTDVPHGEVHLLGYFIDYLNPELLATLEKMRHSRLERAQRMISKLESLGVHLEWQRVQEIAGSGAIGRPHIAQAMLERGYITSPKEAFTKYIGRDGPAYAEREKITPAETVELILQSNGLPVLAHPLTVNNPEAMIIELKASGLVGVEAYYDSYTADEIKELVSLANKHNLITTGGSDFHGMDANNETMMGSVTVPEESVEQLITLARQRKLRLADS